MDGLLLVDKPAGISSFGVVARVRWLIKEATGQKIKIGHTGTLDPAATGLLILVLGKYTKRAGEFSKLDKTYEAELTLGAISSTGDSEGEITKSRQKTVDRRQGRPTKEAVEAVLRQFEGKIQQTPPIYSAVKIDGQRAYKMARKGLTPVMQPREVTIYSLRSTVYKYPKLNIIAEVSSGAYIRSLAADIGKELGTGAYMSNLRRTTVGKFKIENAVNFNSLDFARIVKGLSEHL